MRKKAFKVTLSENEIDLKAITLKYRMNSHKT